MILDKNGQEKLKKAEVSSLKQKPLVKEQVEVPISNIIICIKEEFTKMYPRLQELFDGSPKSIAGELLAVGLLVNEHVQNPSYHVIINAFLNGFLFLDTVDQINEHCCKFLSAMNNVGGPFSTAAEYVRKKLNDSLVKNHNITFHF